MYSLANADPPKSYTGRLVNVTMCSFGNDTDSERTGSVTGSGPASTPVEAHTLIGDNLEQATATEGLGVCLTLDLQNIQREQNDFSDTDQAGGSSQPNVVLKVRADAILSHLPAVACIIAFPVPLPNALSKSVPWCLAR